MKDGALTALPADPAKDRGVFDTIPAVCRDHWRPRAPQDRTLRAKRLRIVALMGLLAALLLLFVEVAGRGSAGRARRALTTGRGRYPWATSSKKSSETC